MDNYISSFLQNIKQKTTNPFLGTIILVFIIRYWDFVYAFFMFDDDCDMLYKQTYIHNYFTKLNFWKEVAVIVSESFLIIIGTYILLTVSRFLQKQYEKQSKRTDKFVDRNSVKTIQEYQALEKRLAEVFGQLNAANNINNELELRIGQFKKEASDRNTEISKLTIEKNNLNEENKELKSESTSINSLNEKLKSELESFKEKYVTIEQDLAKFKSENDQLKLLVENNESDRKNIIEQLNDLKPKFLKTEKLNEDLRLKNSELNSDLKFIHKLKEAVRSNSSFEHKKMGFVNYMSDFLDDKLRTIEFVVLNNTGNLETISLLQFIEHQIPRDMDQVDEMLLSIKNVFYYLHEENKLKEFKNIANNISLNLTDFDIEENDKKYYTRLGLIETNIYRDNNVRQIIYKLTNVGQLAYEMLDNNSYIIE